MDAMISLNILKAKEVKLIQKVGNGDLIILKIMV